MADHDRAADLSPGVDPPDSVESDPAALNSAADLDEDRLDVDPLEKGMDPPAPASPR
jgi:hypothetical protein